MSAVRVVLSNGEDDELDLGIFNQGVVIGDNNKVVLINTASNKPIVVRVNHRHDKRQFREPNASNRYERIFIHGAVV
jgi:hypothetical protein